MKAKFAPLLLSVLAALASATGAQRSAAPSEAYGLRPTAYGHRAPAPSRVWIPGRYETVLRRTWVPSCDRRVWVEPVYEWRRDGCGNLVRVVVREGHWKTSAYAGRYELTPVQVWKPGHWAVCEPGRSRR